MAVDGEVAAPWRASAWRSVVALPCPGHGCGCGDRVILAGSEMAPAWLQLGSHQNGFGMGALWICGGGCWFLVGVFLGFAEGQSVLGCRRAGDSWHHFSACKWHVVSASSQSTTIQWNDLSVVAQSEYQYFNVAVK